MTNFTTNEEDQREAKKLQARLKTSSDYHDGDEDGNDAVGYQRVQNVTMAEGTHKYVLITALLPGSNERQHFVVSRRNAAYHRDAAEPFVDELGRNGYQSISILGGGRIALDTEKKTISIYGFSYGFGLADHALSKSVVESDRKWKDYKVTWSNEGY